MELKQTIMEGEVDELYIGGWREWFLEWMYEKMFTLKSGSYKVGWVGEWTDGKW
jgi:hypothetical protein